MLKVYWLSIVHVHLSCSVVKFVDLVDDKIIEVLMYVIDGMKHLLLNVMGAEPHH